jgi:hypothetical protein
MWNYVRPVWAWAGVCLSFAAVALPKTAAAYEVKHTGSGLPVRWAESNVSFVIDPSVEEAAAGATQAIAQAAAAWAPPPGAPTLSAAPGTSPGKPAVDGINTILYAPHGYGPAGNALAITLVSFDESTGNIVDTDIVINGAHAFSVFAAGTRAPSGLAPVSNEPGHGGDEDDGNTLKFDLQHVVTHEMGHALGLGDVTNDSTAVMFAYTMPDDASLRTPGSDDVAGVTDLYAGANASQQGGCGGGASVAATRVTVRDDGAVAAFALVAGAWLVARRRTRVPVAVRVRK